MEITGKVIQILPLQSGIGKASGKEWKKQEYVIETLGNYPTKVIFHAFNDRVNEFNQVIGAQPGKIVTVSFDLESREFNGRWYTDVRGYRVVEGDGTQSVQQPVQNSNFNQVPPPPVPNMNQPVAPADLSPAPGATDDLPF